MTWGEFLSGLDAVRAKIRLQHGKELDQDVNYGDQVFHWLDNIMNALPAVEPEPQKPILDDLFACIPEDNVSERVASITDRADGEGRMVVMARDTPLILHPIDVVEVEEKDLAR